MYAIGRKMTDDDLNRLIRSLERGTRFLKKLLFIRYRYDGDSVETAAGRIGITKMMELTEDPSNRSGRLDVKEKMIPPEIK